MKKVKLLMLILSAFFAFGIQSASAQYVDVQTAKIRVYDRITQLSKESDDARQAGNEQLYYETQLKNQYYESIMIGFKMQLSVEDALNQVNVATASKTSDTADSPNGLTQQAEKVLVTNLREEADQLLKI